MHNASLPWKNGASFVLALETPVSTQLKGSVHSKAETEVAMIEGVKPMEKPAGPSSPDASSNASTGSKSKGTVGITGLRMRDDLNLLVITKLDPNGAAKRSGMVQENDCLLRVGGVDAKGMSAEQVMPLLKGSVGTKLRLRLSREQDEIDLTLLRAEAVTPTKKRNSPGRSKEASPPQAKPHKATDREKAERLAGGGAQARINAHIHRDHSKDYATKEEIRTVNKREWEVHMEAQEKADKWYNDQVQKDEEERKRKISHAIEQKQPWNIFGIFFGGEEEKKPQTMIEKAQSKVSEAYHDNRHQMKKTMRDRRDQAKINLGLTIVNYKVRKATSEVQAFFEGKPAKKKGWFGAKQEDAFCSMFCAGPRRK